MGNKILRIGLEGIPRPLVEDNTLGTSRSSLLNGLPKFLPPVSKSVKGVLKAGNPDKEADK